MDWWQPCDTFDLDRNLESKSSMTIAARNGHLKILQLFVENLPSIITNSARSWYLLMHAALRGQLHVVKFLIGQGVPVIHVDKSARTSSIVDAAVLKGHLPVVKYIIEEIKFADRSHNSADPLLCLATHAGHLDMVKYLVKCGASFTCQHFYPFHGSAFDIAMDEGWADIASFFLGNATLEDLDIITTSGWKWMSKPCSQDKFGHIFYPSPWKKPSIAHMILDRVDLEKQLTTITPDNEQEVRGRQFHYPNGRPRLDHIHPRSSIQLLVEHGAEINQVDANGRTALFLTTERNNLVLTKELLRLGANPLLKTSANVSALELAISKCQTKHVKAFLKAIEIHSFTCDNFSSLNPDVLPPEKLPNRAPTCASAQFHIFATDFLSVEGIIARNGWMDQPRGSRVPVWCRKSPQNWEEILEESSEESSEEDSDESSGEGSDEEWDNYSVSLQKEGTEEDNFVPIWSATKDDDSISDPRWARFFIAKAMT